MEHRRWGSLSRALVAVAITVGLIYLYQHSGSPSDYSAALEARQDGGEPDLAGYDFDADASDDPGYSAFEATGLNRSALYDSALVRRLPHPEATIQEFTHYRCKGETMLNMLFTPKEELGHLIAGGGDGQATFANQDLLDWEKPLPGRGFASPQELQEVWYLEGLTSVQGFVTRDPVSFTGDDNDLQRSVYRQSKRYTRETGRFSATGGLYDFSLSRKSRVLVINSAWSPKTRTERPDNQLPWVQRLSDILYLEVANRWGFSAPPTSLNGPYNPPPWIVIKEVSGPSDTLKIVTWCLSQQHPELVRDGRYPDWTLKQTFPIGSSCHAALLATPNSYGVAMFYLTHKYRFGDWVPGSVTVFSDGNNGPNGEMPTLIWWAGKAEGANLHLRDARRRNKDAEIQYSQDPTADPGLVPYPFPMELIYG